ncbi:MAG: hypothetical protein FJ317_02285 [SAR202 cluster bacterium]|nr:hypothetical protein [SAR202 cluster bacterium]
MLLDEVVNKQTFARIARHLGGVETSPVAEWTWVIGRILIALACLVGTYLFLDELGVLVIVSIVLGFTMSYSLVLAAVLLSRQYRTALFAGSALDSAVMLTLWLVIIRSLSTTASENDMYLALYPILAIAILRLGWLMGIVFAVVWLGWFGWSTLAYFPADSYAVQQLPLRIVFIAITIGLVSFIVSQFQFARRDELAKRREAEQRLREVSALNRLFREHMQEEHAEELV